MATTVIVDKFSPRAILEMLRAQYAEAFQDGSIEEFQSMSLEERVELVFYMLTGVNQAVGALHMGEEIDVEDLSEGRTN